MLSPYQLIANLRQLGHRAAASIQRTLRLYQKLIAESINNLDIIDRLFSLEPHPRTSYIGAESGHAHLASKDQRSVVGSNPVLKCDATGSGGT